MASAPGKQHVVPEWLDEAFVERALQKGLRCPLLKVTSIEAKSATADGDHYASEMFRVAVNFVADCEKTGSISIIVKAALSDKKMGELTDVYDIFRKEGEMMANILPIMLRTLNGPVPNKFEPFAAECYFRGNVPVKFLVIEDLAPMGYHLAQRLKGLDLDHCVLAMKAIAHFHVSSAILIRSNPKMFANFKEGGFSEKTKEVGEVFVKLSFQTLAKVVKNWDEGYMGFADRLNLLADTLFDDIIKLVAADNAGWKVLCHADMWVNNMLFKYSGNDLEKVKFVDFQISFVSSPAVDLQYFFYTSASQEVRTNHLDYLLNVYCTEYNHVLDHLGHDDMKITLEKLKREFERYNLYGLYSLVCVLPIVMRDPKQAFGVQDLFDDSEEAQNMAGLYNNQSLVSEMKRCLQIFESKGVL